MNSIKTLYKLMEVSSRDLEIPDAYQPTNRRSAFVTVTIMCLTGNILLWRAST